MARARRRKYLVHMPCDFLPVGRRASRNDHYHHGRWQPCVERATVVQTEVRGMHREKQSERREETVAKEKQNGKPRRRSSAFVVYRCCAARTTIRNRTLILATRRDASSIAQAVRHLGKSMMTGGLRGCVIMSMRSVFVVESLEAYCTRTGDT